MNNTTIEIGLHDAKRAIYLLNNHQKLLSMLKTPDVLKVSLSNDISTVCRILEKAKIASRETTNVSQPVKEGG